MATANWLVRSGDLLDQYVIERLAATGGTASVFRAIDTRSGKPVAIKVPNSKLGERRFGWNFASAGFAPTPKMDHPGIVRVVQEATEGRGYIVMEWIEGRCLRRVLEEATVLPVERAIDIALRICDPLEYLHRLGIVHRDLKPENVMVAARDEVKLIDADFSAPPRAGFFPCSKPKMTGTPDYASPEQIQGRRTDARSDIYALGMMLYEMVTGELPFSGVDPATALQLRLKMDPPDAREIRPDVPPDLEDLIRGTLSRRPDERPATVSELAAELAKIAAFCVPEFAELV